MLAKSISGAAAAASPVFVEDTFSTYLYTGTGATQTITNNIDLSGKGGLVWIKGRSGATGHRFTDTARGATKSLASNSAAAAVTESTGLTAFNGTGFSIGADADYNTNTATYVSWAFREQAKFFDVVTYTGDGTNGRTVTHNLGSTPGCIIVKCISTGYNWAVWHRSVPTQKGFLNLTSAFSADTQYFDSTGINSTQIKFATDTGEVNQVGDTYVAYLFAHDAGGFGLTGTDNVISCGSYTGNGSATGPVINLGYEPQWLLVKRSDGTGTWYLVDNMRGFTVSGSDQILEVNGSGVDYTGTVISVNSTGFQLATTNIEYNASGGTYIYIAIRRGPMKVPTSGTSVFNPNTSYSTISSGKFGVTTGFPVDALLWRTTAATTNASQNGFMARLTGGNDLKTYSTAAEATNILGTFDYSTQVAQQAVSTGAQIYLSFRRAPGFFDVVCYTGNGNASQLVTHNLGVAPELYICKARNGVSSWEVWSKTTGVNAVYTLALQSDGGGIINSAYNGYATSTTIEVGGQVAANTNAATYVAYLFATVAGVSKVGRYTGTGTTKQIDCGFTGGARFVLIKRTDSTGNWYVWDTARGIVAGNDPYLLLNSTAAEVTNTDYVDTYSAGFEISSTAPAAINANGGTFIFLAIA